MIKNALETQLGFTYMTAQANLEGIDHDASLATPGSGGNSMNWVLGHIVNTRNLMLELLGGEPAMDEKGAALYGRGSKAIGPGSECLPFDELRGLLAGTQETLLERLAAADDALLAREVPELFEPDKMTACATKLATLLFHEAYHMGQLGTIRCAIGKGPMIS